MSSPQVVIVDDSNGAISYSGPWSSASNPGAHDGTLHQTSTSGSSNTLTYVGSPTVTIFGSIQPCDSQHSNPIYEITMDGVTTPIMSVICDREFQNGLSVTAQGQGTSGVNARHVVTLTNLGGSQNLPLMLDYIQYISYVEESSTGVAQAPPPSTTGAGSPTMPVSTPVATTNAAPASHSSSSAANTSESPSGSTGPAGSSLARPTAGVSSSSGPKSLSASTTVELTTINGVATSITVVTTPTPTAGSNSSDVSSTGAESSTSRSGMIGAIVGGIIGAVILTLLLVLLYSRRRRIFGYFFPGKESGESIAPFHLAPNSSPEEAGVLATEHSNITFPSDEKRAMASIPVSRPQTSDSSEVAEGPLRAESEVSSSSAPSSAPLIPVRQRSPSPRPSSTAVLPYLRNSTFSRGHDHHTSGVSGFSDVPPAYDSVRNTATPVVQAPPSPTSEPLEYQ